MLKFCKQLLRGWVETAREFGGTWRVFLAFELLCKLLMVAIYAPISAWFLNAILRSSGDTAVSNFDLLAFFVSPPGLLLIVTFATASFALLFFELGGTVLIAFGIGRGQRLSPARTLRFLAGRFARLCQLGFRQFLIVGGIAAIVLAIGAVTKMILLAGGDIYFYWIVRPPEFWLAVAIVAIASLTAAVVIVVFLLRWIFALPLMLIENQTPRGAMASSRWLVQETGPWKIVNGLVVWAVGMLLFMAVAAAAHALLSWILLWLAGSRVGLVIAIAGLLLAIDGILSLVVGFISAVTFASLIAQFYSAARSKVCLPDSLIANHAPVKQLRIRTCVFAAAIGVVCMSAVSVYSIISQIRFDDTIEVTAHRGSVKAAPENTMAAVLQAIMDGADVAEIDVQETADGVVVLLHDKDLRRVAGVNKGIWEVTLAELGQLDVGSWFSPEFADTRVPTLEEVIAAVKGKMKLNIEMKFNGHQQQLEAEVVRIVNELEFQRECVITSLVYRGLQEIQRQDPQLQRGMIVTAKLGDATQLDVDMLAVNANSVTRDLITRAHREGKEVHVWTVNEPNQMLTMIHLGVDNILTSKPDVVVELLRERENMSNAEKTLLFVSDFLAGRL